MVYAVFFKAEFKRQFQYFPRDQQDAVLAFVETFQQNGLGDFTKYSGKISPSWSSLSEHDPIYAYAKANHLWHYHIGIPIYTMRHDKYQTSDYVLHFQWRWGDSSISLVDVCYHYRADGTFHLPAEVYLT